MDTPSPPERGPAPPDAPDRSGTPAVARHVTPDEREATVTRLSSAFARDLLAVEDFERRVSEAYRAPTAAELERLTADLPEAEARAGPRYEPHRPAPDRMSPRVRATLGSVERAGPVAVPSKLEIRAIFGNVELDLRDAEFASDVVEISVRAVFGNIEVVLPADVEVANDGSAFLGSFVVRATPGGSGVTVRVRGGAILGNVEFDYRPPRRPALGRGRS